MCSAVTIQQHSLSCVFGCKHMYSCWHNNSERSLLQFNKVSVNYSLHEGLTSWAQPSISGVFFKYSAQKESSVYQKYHLSSIIHGRVGQLSSDSCSKFHFRRHCNTSLLYRSAEQVSYFFVFIS